MTRKIRLLKFCTLIGLASAAQVNVCAENAVRPEKPNVVLIYTDDLGWQDVKCYDVDDPAPYDTPNIDALAQRGVLFQQAYSPAPTCAPSRCAIMSGLHPARMQKTHVLGGQPPTPTHMRDPFIAPWYRGGMGVEVTTLAEALQANGYRTGHSGKWHIAINHNAYPQPKDHGFDFNFSGRGANTKMKPDRLSDFATNDAKDPYRLDADGYPSDEVTENAIHFIETSKAEPFFLYYATWLVHYPIQTRSKALLQKYCERMGMEYPSKPDFLPKNGKQKNPYYGAMVEMLDAYVGDVLEYLEATDDPRWPGHKLIENTYVIFSSDNGGCEGSGETYTTNAPLDMGKSSVKEGGTRVPLIIIGPDIKAGVESNVLANGLDFYPTVLSWTDTDNAAGVEFDGCDLSKLLTSDPSDAALVKDRSGMARTSVLHHFPHGNKPQSSIRVGGYKLIYNHGQIPGMPNRRPELELYQLYDADNGRVDIEESKNLASAMPEKAAAMKQQLFEALDSMDASTPYFNPRSQHALDNKASACTPLEANRHGNTVTLSFQENGAKVVQAHLMVTFNGGDTYEEWYRTDAVINDDTSLTAELPEGATHYVFNLIDEHGFMVSYPELIELSVARKNRTNFSSLALNAHQEN